MLGHRHDAEDVTQEVFVRALRHLGRWDSARPLKPWLFTIAANRCRTLLANRARKGTVTTYDNDVPANEADPLSASELAEELQTALELLREEYRLCFVLFHQQELSCAQIGEVLGCPQGTVKTWLHRARRELAEHLKRRGRDGEVSHELHRI
jgi:RNA polymerase sigma-70 factor (ECF subfamily)